MNETPQAVLAHAVASSVDPLEAAVVLESRGINDRLARDLFGAPDVVALAEREIRAAGPDRATTEPDAAPAPPAALAPPPTRCSRCAGSSTPCRRSSRSRWSRRSTRSSRRSC